MKIIGIVLGIIAVFTIPSIVILGLYQSYRNNEMLPQKTVSIQKYDQLNARLQYVDYMGFVKDIIINDLANGRVDTAFINSIWYHLSPAIFTDKTVTSTNSHDVRPPNEEMLFTLDSLLANHYETISYMFMDKDHDSTWVKNSDTYKITSKLVKELRNKK